LRRPAFLFFILFIMALTGCAGNNVKAGPEPVNLTVAAAASLQDAAEEIKAVYATKNPGVRITYNFSSSGTLQKQIEEGAPADLFISSGKSQMDALSRKGLIIEASRVDLLGNELVLIAGRDASITGFEDLAGPVVTRISIGTPETVPAGSYAKEVLTTLNLWDKLQPKMVLAKDVRQVLTYVETGNVDAGLVYRTDAVSGKKVKIVAAAPAGSHKPVVYPMAVMNNTGNKNASEEFAAYLSGREAAAVFEKYGFKTIKK